MLVFDKPPDAFSVAGAAIILATTVGMAVAKHLASKKSVAVAVRADATGNTAK